MSIFNPKIYWRGESARLEHQTGLPPKRTRTVVWSCTSDRTNSIDVVKDFHAHAGTPSLGDALDGDPTSILKSMDATRADGSNSACTNAWYVNLDYSPRDEAKEEKPDEDGKPTSDPLQWRDELAISFSRISVPVYRATYRGGYVGHAAALVQPGFSGMPCNSAFVPFNPGLEKDISLRTIRISKWRPEVDGERLNDIQNRVNNALFVINKPAYKFKDKWPQYCARIMNAGGAFQLVNEIKCWKVDYEVAVREDGWRVEVPDRGVVLRAIPGVDPNGEGGVITPPPQSDEFGQPIPPPQGQTFHRNNLDHQFVPITEPILLNGDGQPLRPGQPTVYILFSIFPEGPYGGIDL